MDKIKTTEQVYNGPLGFGSLQNTLKGARKLDPTITLEGVKRWKDNNTERKHR